MDYQKQIEKIREIGKKVSLNEVTILTGKNGSGKSLVRKIVGSYIAQKLNLDPESSITSSTSMQQRTESRSDFGAFSSLLHDSPDSPTSFETFYKIKTLLKSCSEQKRFIIFDEPEIGMGEELVMSLVNWLNSIFNPIPQNCYGILVITHNRYIVQNLKGTFLNFEDMSREEWLNREIVPVDLETFEKESSELFHAIQDILNSKEKD